MCTCVACVFPLHVNVCIWVHMCRCSGACTRVEDRRQHISYYWEAVHLPFFSETASLPDLELTLTGRLAFQEGLGVSLCLIPQYWFPRAHHPAVFLTGPHAWFSKFYMGWVIFPALMFASQVRATPRSQRLLFLRTQLQIEILKFFLPVWSLAHYLNSARDVPWSMLLLSRSHDAWE